ncbi:MAG: DUF4860 domain-containing protein [Clostridiaceae bacterium]|jgi:hypothetical protein|nr:DUF4860 domain-containing protein [Clostridiaceae bacterium]
MKEVLNNSILKPKNGRAMIETLSVMLLLILLGTGCFSLSLSSFGAYKRLNDAREKSTELRIASSFIVTKIRQNDVAGSIDVKPEPITGKNALVIYEHIDGESYATWIYYSAGYLMEALVLEHEEPSPDVSQQIAKVDDFNIEYDRDVQRISTSISIDGLRPYNSTATVRSK